jgi:hypothetical protein
LGLADVSRRMARALPGDDCVADCRLVAAVGETSAPVAYAEAGGGPPCRACLEALAESAGAERVDRPRRPRRGDTPGATASWEEALAWTAEALRSATEGGRRLVWISLARRPRLQDALTRRVTGLVPEATWVRWIPPVERVARLMAGRPEAAAAPHGLEQADLLLVWGADPETGSQPLRRALDDARSRGARLAVVDPRRTGLARQAGLHLAPRPGADVALAAALIHELRPGDPPEWVRPWPVPRAAPVCRVSEEVLRGAAAWLAEARRPVILGGGGLGWHPAPEDAVEAVARLAGAAGAALAGPEPAPDPSLALELPLGAVEPTEPLALDRPLGETGEPERCLVVLEGAVDLERVPGGAGLAEWLSGADRILALVNRWGSVAAAADLALPLPSPFERRGAVGLRYPAELWVGETAEVRPRDLPDPWRLWRTLAHRVGWPERWFDQELTPGAGPASGGPPRAGGRMPGPAADPTHRELGEGAIASPALAESYPLALVVGQRPPWLAGEDGKAPVAMLAPAEAQRRGLDDGDRVTVFNGRGSLSGRLAVVEQASGTVALGSRGAGLVAGLDGGRALAGALVEVAPAD